MKKLPKHGYSVPPVSSTTVPSTMAQDTMFRQLSPTLNFTNAGHTSFSLSHPALSAGKGVYQLLTGKMHHLLTTWAVPLG